MCKLIYLILLPTKRSRLSHSSVRNNFAQLSSNFYVKIATQIVNWAYCNLQQLSSNNYYIIFKVYNVLNFFEGDE